MKKFALLVLVTLFVLSGLSLVGKSSTARAKVPKILEFETMIGVPSGLTGAQSQAPLRGLVEVAFPGH